MLNIIKQKWYYFLIIVLFLFCVSEAYILFRKKDIKENENVLENSQYIVENDSQSDNPEITFFVDVKGAVKNPGVYQLKENSIVNDVINLAGGFNKNSYKNNINLSKKISDEMVIYVYTTYEYKTKFANKEKTETCNTNDVNIGECINKGNSTIVSNETTNEVSDNMVNEADKIQIVNINTASKEELTTISGIGESKAKSIIDYREEHGNFKDIEDIQNVSGIGATVYAKIKDYITV